MRYMVVNTHDERYDFNFSMNWEEIDDVEKWIKDNTYFGSDPERRTLEDGTIISKINREHFLSEKRFDYKQYNDKFKVLSFEVNILIPEKAFWAWDFRLLDGIINRNSKYGFIDFND